MGPTKTGFALQTNLSYEMQASADTIQTKSAIFLPDEIVFHILHSLDPHEVIRLRLVRTRASQKFVGPRRPADCLS